MEFEGENRDPQKTDANDPGMSAAPSVPRSDGRGRRRFRSLQLLVLALASGVLISAALVSRGPRCRYPATAVATIFETRLDCATAGRRDSWIQRLLSDPDPDTLEDALDEAIDAYQQTLKFEYVSHDALEARLIVLLCERGRNRDARLLLKHFEGPHWGFVHTVATAYPNVLSDSPPLVPAFLPEVLDAVERHDPERRWTLDRLEQRWANQTGDEERSERGEKRILERAGKWRRRYDVTDDLYLGVLAAGIIGIIALALASLPRWRAQRPTWPESWPFGDGVAVIVIGAIYWFLAVITSGFGLAYIPYITRLGVLIIYLPVVWLARRQLIRPNEQSFRSALGLRVSRIGWPLLSAWALALVVADQLLYAILQLVPAQDAWWEWWREALLRGDALTGAMDLLAAVVWAPLLEELVFRGLVFGTLRMRLGGVNAAIISSWLFAATHFYSPIGFVSIFTFGLIACFAYARTRSLLVPMLFHAITNAQIYAMGWIEFRM